MSGRITDPARMLAGYTFSLPEPLKCYCLGCYAPARVGRRHARFGNVDACEGHDPERFGQTRGFGVALQLQAPTAPPEQGPATEPTLSDAELIAELLKQIIGLASKGGDNSGDDGKGARLKKPTPKLPPTGHMLQAPPSKAQGRAA